MRVLRSNPFQILRTRFSTLQQPDTSSSSYLPGFLMFATAGGFYYLYHDPQVLPASIQKYLPIQKNETKSMSLEEYEQWRHAQDRKEGESTLLHFEALAKDTPVVEESENEQDNPLKHMFDSASAENMKSSLEEMLQAIQVKETAYQAQIKQNKKQQNRWFNTTEENNHLNNLNQEKKRITDLIQSAK